MTRSNDCPCNTFECLGDCWRLLAAIQDKFGSANGKVARGEVVPWDGLPRYTPQLALFRKYNRLGKKKQA
ncbi:MAG: hypothetical protein ACR2H5_07250 [Ktedonobacteraceae bacterium]